MNEFLHDEDIAKLLRISVQGLRNKIEAGDPLPPSSQPPGMRVRLWPKKQVEEWLLQFLKPQAVQTNVDEIRSVKQRGRTSRAAGRALV